MDDAPIVAINEMNLDLAFLRAGMISAGMVAALIMNSLVFPRHCRVRAQSCATFHTR